MEVDQGPNWGCNAKEKKYLINSYISLRRSCNCRSHAVGYNANIYMIDE
jgi:hypothetical protein